MGMESAPSLNRVKMKEQGPDQKRVGEFVIPITRFIEGDKQAIEILRGKVDKKDREALKVAIAQVQTGLGNRYKSTVGRGVGTVESMQEIHAKETKADAGLEEKLIRLEKLKDQLAFAA